MAQLLLVATPAAHGTEAAGRIVDHTPAISARKRGCAGRLAPLPVECSGSGGHCTQPQQMERHGGDASAWDGANDSQVWQRLVVNVLSGERGEEGLCSGGGGVQVWHAATALPSGRTPCSGAQPPSGTRAASSVSVTMRSGTCMSASAGAARTAEEHRRQKKQVNEYKHVRKIVYYRMVTESPGSWQAPKCRVAACHTVQPLMCRRRQ